MDIKVGVLMGGLSAEREVSLRSGEAVYQALVKLGYNAVKIDAGRRVAGDLKRESIQLAFLALHGPYGEDGSIQGLLEYMGIPYTGPGVRASAICMDKITTKKILVYEGLSTPAFMHVSNKDYTNDPNACISSIVEKMPLPMVVKAPTQGSTIGTSFVRYHNEIQPALELSLRYDREALVEEMVQGVEITASILGNDDPVALPLIEIVSKTGVYDFEAKYTAGLSDHIIPPCSVPVDVQEQIKELAIRAYKATGCRGLARVDFMVDKRGPAILEINTLPGMTEVSLFPDAARAAGIEFTELVNRLVKLALEI